MNTMDLNGVAWVGNIYQKFEAMCLEVEETIVEDTAKYVENQVQTVGASVKKFYSDVMQDLLLPSCVDPMNVVDADLSVHSYVDLGIHKKPKASIKENTRKVDNLSNEDTNVNAGVDAGTSQFNRLHSLNHILPSYSEGSAKEPYSESYSRRCEDRETYRRSNTLKKISKKKNFVPSSKKLTSNDLLSKDQMSATPVVSGRDISENHEPTWDQRNMISPPVKTYVPPSKKLSSNNMLSKDQKRASPVVSAHDISENHEPTRDRRNMISPQVKNYVPPSKKLSSNDMLLKDQSRASPVVSARDRSKNHEATRDQITMMSPERLAEVSGCDFIEEAKICNDVVDATASMDVASIETPTSDIILPVDSRGKNGRKLGCISSSSGLSAESLETCTNSGLISEIASCADTDTECGQSASEESFRSPTGSSKDCVKDVTDTSDTTVPEMETIRQDDKVSLEETCVWVDGDQLCSVSVSGGKHRSYKKKIREALSLKMKSSRKQEYEQLAAKFGDGKTSLNAKIPSSHSSSETEWELL